MRRLSRELEESAYWVELRVEGRIVQADKLQPTLKRLRPLSALRRTEAKAQLNYRSQVSYSALDSFFENPMFQGTQLDGSLVCRASP